jgi:GTPase
MLGVLVKGGLDDGRGKARVNLFRHKHEIESGRTSSVSMEIMGFDSRGEVVSSNVAGRKLTWEEIGRRSVSWNATVNSGMLQLIMIRLK